MTWEELKLATIQKMFSANGSTIPTDDSTRDYLAAMPQVANEGILMLSTAGKFLVKSVSISINPIPNILGKETGGKIHLKESGEMIFNGDCARSYYFEATGKRQISNDDCVISVQERTTVDYDIDALSEKLPDEILSKIIEKRYEIVDWDKFVKFLKSYGIKSSAIRPHISVTKSINKENLSALYERKKLSIKDIEGCYTAKITKSVVLRLKNAKQEINIT